ncbi:MAG: AraC family transcriptional regulator [Clostridia bacterium]|nr:AraC family transcriptional regulator [Clostridia bacterium]
MSLPEGKNLWVESLSETDAAGMSQSHFHDYYEIYYLLEGKRRYFINHTLYDVTANDIILVNKGDIHLAQSANPPVKYARCLITFSDQFLNNLGSEFDKDFFIKLFDTKKIHITESMQNTFNMLLHKAETKIKQNDIYSQYIAKLNILELLVNIHKFSTKNNTPLMDDLTVYEDRIQEVCRYICNYYNKPISLNEMAKIAYMSPTYFSKKFKRVTGFGFNEYLNNVRIKMATSLLMETQSSITEIATFCGYQDSNYFGDVFKKIIGISPNKYRKEHYIL